MNFRFFIKSLAVILVLALSVPVGGGTEARAAVADKVIIVINDEVVTQAEFDRAFDQRKRYLEANFKGEELRRRLETTPSMLRDQLINAKLVVSLAKKQNIQIDQAELETAMNEIKGGFKTEGEFQQALNKRGTNMTEFEREIRDQMLARKLIEEEVTSKIIITPAELRDLFEKNKEAIVAPKRIKLRGITVKKTADRSNAESEKIANKLYSKARKSKDFEKIAKESSEGPYAAEGGDMGYVEQGQGLPPSIEAVVFKMKTGEVSEVMESEMGYHVFLAEEVEEPRSLGALGFDEVSELLRERLFMEKYQEDMVKWLEEKRKNAYISYK